MEQRHKYCLLHSDSRPVFCSNHSILCCETCHVKNNKGCVVMSISNACDYFQSEIATSTDSLNVTSWECLETKENLLRRRDNMQQQRNSAIDSLDTFTAQLYKIIGDFNDEAKQKIESISADQLTFYKLHIERMDDLYSYIAKSKISDRKADFKMQFSNGPNQADIKKLRSNHEEMRESSEVSRQTLSTTIREMRKRVLISFPRQTDILDLLESKLLGLIPKIQTPSINDNEDNTVNGESIIENENVSAQPCMKREAPSPDTNEQTCNNPVNLEDGMMARKSDDGRKFQDDEDLGKAEGAAVCKYDFGQANIVSQSQLGAQSISPKFKGDSLFRSTQLLKTTSTEGAAVRNRMHDASNFPVLAGCSFDKSNDDSQPHTQNRSFKSENHSLFRKIHTLTYNGKRPTVCAIQDSDGEFLLATQKPDELVKIDRYGREICCVRTQGINGMCVDEDVDRIFAAACDGRIDVYFVYDLSFSRVIICDLGKCFDVCKLGDRLMVLHERSGNSWSVSRVNCDSGEVLQTFTEHAATAPPCSVITAPHKGCTHLFVSEPLHSCITILHGNLQHHIVDNNPELNRPNGMCVVGSSIYVADYNSRRVLKVCPDCDFCRTVLSEFDGIGSPRSICFHKETRRLVVCSFTGPRKINITVFEMRNAQLAMGFH